MSERDTLEELGLCLLEKYSRIVPFSFKDYVKYYSEQSQKWFHKRIADACQQVYSKKINRLMIFIPPQHGKSSLVSKLFPAWVIGNDPTRKIVNASYSSDLATSFSKSVQRIIQDPRHTLIFGDVMVKGDGLVRNADYFELTGGGYYKAVGVGGALTGRQADIAIIDDPVKDALEAFSETYRNRVWEWYINVLETRLHNDSSVILIQTRWHEDDLAGRLLNVEAEKWKVIKIPAIKDDNKDSDDPRKIGEALWPERHSMERLLEQKGRSERTFASLYQQNPVVDGGNIIKSDWLNAISYTDFEGIKGNAQIIFFVDTAFTDKNANDPTGIIATCKTGNDLYITGAAKVRMKFPDLVKWLPKWAVDHGYTPASSIRIEPKANGLSVIHQLQATTGLNITQTPPPTESKETRMNVISPTVEGGRVCLVKGGWNDEFIQEICSFPSAPHDEYADLLCYAIEYHIGIQLRSSGKLGKYFH